MMKKLLSLTGAFGDYDRIRAMDIGSCQPQGIDLRILKLPPSEIFFRMCQYREFDVSEMSMGAFCYLCGKEDNPFVAMPAFPSRAFRHSMVYYRTDAGITTPEDLNGKRIAIREWGMTAVVWIIGILKDMYGFDLHSVDWVAAKKPRVPIEMPPGARIRYMRGDQNLSDMLASGEVDAALIHQAPECFFRRSTARKANVSRLQDSRNQLLPGYGNSSDNALCRPAQGHLPAESLGFAQYLRRPFQSPGNIRSKHSPTPKPWP